MVISGGTIVFIFKGTVEEVKVESLQNVDLRTFNNRIVLTIYDRVRPKCESRKQAVCSVAEITGAGDNTIWRIVRTMRKEEKSRGTPHPGAA